MADNLDLSALDIGVSSTGMGTYKENLRAVLLTQTKDKLASEYESIRTVINTGWQGVSRDKFLEQLSLMCERIGTDLAAEYEDLEARLVELEAFYFTQDQALIED